MLATKMSTMFVCLFVAALAVAAAVFRAADRNEWLNATEATTNYFSVAASTHWAHCSHSFKNINVYDCRQWGKKRTQKKKFVSQNVPKSITKRDDGEEWYRQMRKNETIRDNKKTIWTVGNVAFVWVQIVFTAIFRVFVHGKCLVPADRSATRWSNVTEN